MKCVIFDMDGTLANVEHRRHHLQKDKPDLKSWNKEIANDTPNEHICELACLYHRQGYKIIVCSGRFEEYRGITKIQLYDWIHYEALYMRKDGDYRSDVDVKQDMLNAIISQGYKPVISFDDRDKVVKMWRDNNIPCCQVAEGAF